MRAILLLLSCGLVLAACAQLEGLRGAQAPAPDAAPAATPPQARPAGITPPQDARTVEEFDTTTEADRAAARAPARGAARDLGLTIASLGAPTEPGFWLKTPLVSAPGRGRVENPANGMSAQVDLIPIDGPKTAGSRMSLAAMRALGADLAGLPEVRVYQSVE